MAYNYSHSEVLKKALIQHLSGEIAPLNFKDWTSINDDIRSPNNGISAETALRFDIADYAFNLEYLLKFNSRVESIRQEEIDTFNFEVNRPGVPTVREWCNRTKKRSTGFTNSQDWDRYIVAVAAYGELLRPVHSDFDCFMRVRDTVAGMVRRALEEELRSAATPDGPVYPDPPS
ncbi:hypothetical protein L207DRAFT_565193 [Hyaloscypha variabilis F]|uniref:Uncharacterized protein n=1 Tax=Hyaloscypha variabilis (strain UAMH 11265 / GT02V1 / F) TaxID=1149755 RepID=A0A2J6RRW4_HYAVF|nr:hypothetical protein L207DRAFT_565193 [Hyaloscypha variabilis F]